MISLESSEFSFFTYIFIPPNHLSWEIDKLKILALKTVMN